MPLNCDDVEKATPCECDCPHGKILPCTRRPGLYVTPVVYQLCATRQKNFDRLDADARYGGPQATKVAASLPAMAGRVVKAYAGNVGKPPASAELIEQRLAICADCNFYLADKKRCAHKDCGCRLQAKARMVDEHCPIDRW